MKALDLTGKKFGKLTVIEFAGHQNNTKQRQWLCYCECGNQKVIRRDHLTKGYTKSCGCEWHSSKSTHNSWRGYEEIPLDFFTNIKRGASNRNIEFDITIEYLWELFVIQNRKCALSGVDLQFGRTNRDRVGRTVSVDRINSNKGYVIGNIQWIDKRINIMKNKMDEQEFLSICKQIIKYKNL
jgi:hypothetical protein